MCPVADSLVPVLLLTQGAYPGVGTNDNQITMLQGVATLEKPSPLH